MNPPTLILACGCPVDADHASGDRLHRCPHGAWKITALRPAAVTYTASPLPVAS